MAPLYDDIYRYNMNREDITRAVTRPQDQDLAVLLPTRKSVGLQTIPHGVYLHARKRDHQIPHGVTYLCTDIQKRFRAWPILARIKITGLQHPIPSTGTRFLDDDIATALDALSGTMLGEDNDRRPFEAMWPGPAELFLLHRPDQPMLEVDFELGWSGGNRTLGTCEFGDLRKLTRSGQPLQKFCHDLPSWRHTPPQH